MGDHSGELRLPSIWTEELGHYLGWLVGDGSTAGATTATIYGSADDRTEILPAHTELLTWINGDRPIKLSRAGEWHRAAPPLPAGSSSSGSRRSVSRR